MLQVTLFILATLLCAGSAWAAPGTQCSSLVELIEKQPDYSYFGVALSVSDINFDAGQSYTILAPSNKELSKLFTQYGIGLTAAEMKANDLFPRIVPFLKYYVLPGKYSMADLVSESKTKGIPTLFKEATDGPQVCVDPSSDDKTIRPSDGNLQFFQNGTIFSVMDDSTTTAKTNNFVQYDLVGCEGFLNLMEDVLNPCAPDITAAPIFNGTASPPPPSVSSSYMLRATAIVGLVVVAAAMLLL